MRTVSFSLAVLVAVMSLALAPRAAAESHVELILDASGSMFNKLDDGRYRIVAAKDVLTQLIAALPETEGLNVGLRVYGWELRGSDPGSCEDSRLFVPIDGVDRQLLLDTVRNTQARGSTPIAYSLQRAADDLSGRTGTKVVVLITDGLEACGGDVRGAAEALKAAGVDLRIIGFDLDPRSAASFDGLGTFENAASAAELLSALNRAVAVAATVKEIPTYKVTVTLTRGGEPVAEGATVTFVPALGDASQGEGFKPSGNGVFEALLPAGNYSAQLADAFAEEPVLVTGIVVMPEARNEFTFELAPKLSVTLTPETGTPNAGSMLSVSWEGAPATGGDSYIELGVEGEDLYLDTMPAPGEAGTVEFRLPMVTGPLELRFLVPGPDNSWPVAGRTTIDLQAVTASLDAPDEATAGSTIEVAWTGPDNKDDYITVVEAGAPEGTWMQYAYTSEGNPVSLRLPEEAGDFELRYQDGYQDTTLASRPLTLTPQTASFVGPATAMAASQVEIEVTSSTGNSDDYLTIVPPTAEEGAYLGFTYVSEPGVYSVTAPDAPGEYEIRYQTGGEDKTLVRQKITLTEAHATLSAPDVVAPDEFFDVTWTGPNGEGDFITIVPVGTPEGDWGYSLNTSSGSTLELEAPAEPGEYEVRYVTGMNTLTLASRPITVR
ncbi:MAG: VWA domain-containing protein [Trueperaceae bacterium]